MRVLIVEDELKMASLVRRGLAEEGHPADVAATGDDALWMAEAHPYDAIVLDVMLPGISGFETCRRLRNAGIWTPVLMLTARDGGRRPGRRSRRWRRRLPGQALLVCRALRATAGVGSQGRRRAPDRGRGRRSPAGSGDPPRVARRGRDPALSQGVRAPGDVHAPAGPGALPAATARARLGLRLREPVERDRRLRALSAGEDRPPLRHGARSRRCRGVGYRLRDEGDR